MKPPAPPALPRHAALDLALRQSATRLAEDFLAFAQLAAEAHHAALWTHFGYREASGYWEEHVGVSYRHVMRWVALAEALRRLPPADQPALEAALPQLGIVKAAVLAPILGQDGQDWRQWVERAHASTRADLQTAVSAATGAKPRGPAAPDRLLRCLFSALPPDTHDEVGRVFEAVGRVGETQNATACFLYMVRRMATDLQDQGERW